MNFNITRRQFLQYCTASAAALGLSQTDLLKLEKALATPQTGCSSPTPSVVWIEGQNCSGCQTSLLNRVVDCGLTGYYDADMINPLYGLGGLAPHPAAYYTVSQGTPSDPIGLPLNVVNDVVDLLVGDGVRALTGIARSLSWADDLGGVGLLPSPNPFPNGFVTLELLHTVQAGAGAINVDHLGPIVNSGAFVLLMDGSIPDADERFCLVFDETANNWTGLGQGHSVTLAEALRWMFNSGNMLAAISVGTCSSYGGIPSGRRNKTGAMGLKAWAAKEGFATSGIVNVPGCPPHPDWIVFPVAYFLINGALPPLDFLGRPEATYGAVSMCTICGNEPTRGTLDAAQFLGDDGCQVGMGCKGLVTFGDCPVRQKNTMDDGTKANWCAASGYDGGIGQARYVCHGCIDKEFPDFANLAGVSPGSLRTEKKIKGFFNKLAGE